MSLFGQKGPLPLRKDVCVCRRGTVCTQGPCKQPFPARNDTLGRRLRLPARQMAPRGAWEPPPPYTITTWVVRDGGTNLGTRAGSTGWGYLPGYLPGGTPSSL